MLSFLYFTNGYPKVAIVQTCKLLLSRHWIRIGLRLVFILKNAIVAKHIFSYSSDANPGVNFINILHPPCILVHLRSSYWHATKSVQHKSWALLNFFILVDLGTILLMKWNSIFCPQLCALCACMLMEFTPG